VIELPYLDNSSEARLDRSSQQRRSSNPKGDEYIIGLEHESNQLRFETMSREAMA
jgi:hypothetical protein